MQILEFDKTPSVQVRAGVKRKIIHGTNLMTVISDFSNGPWSDPEPQHYHLHEQSSYVALGEIFYVYEDEPPQHLKAGDVFFVPSGKKHAIQLLTEKVRLVDNFTPLRTDFL